MKNKVRNLNLNKQKWSVRIVDSHHAGLVCEGGVCRGCTWSGKQIIYLSNELDASNVLRVITHELVHATLAATQMSIPEEFNEEQVADFFSIYGSQIAEAAKELERWALNENNSSV